MDWVSFGNGFVGGVLVGGIIFIAVTVVVAKVLR